MAEAQDPNAYTLGNPEVYDELLEDGLTKQAGGAVFWTREDAADALQEGRFGHYLPEVWFPDAGPVPGAIYGLRVEPDDVSEDTDPVGAHRLLTPAPITGRIPFPNVTPDPAHQKGGQP